MRTFFASSFRNSVSAITSVAMKFLLALSMCCLMQKNSAGQSWSIEINPTGSNHLKSLAITPDGNILIGGTILRPIGDDPDHQRAHMWLTMFNAEGAVQWSKTYRLPVPTQGWDQHGYDVAVDTGGDIYFVGSGNHGGILLKLQSDGDVIWTRTLGYGIDSAFLKVVTKPGGGVCLLGALHLEEGFIGRGQALVVSFDADGNVETQRRLDTPSSSHPRAFACDSDGRMFVSVGTSDQIQLYSLNSAGEITWQRGLETGSVVAVEPTVSGNSVWLLQSNFRPSLMELDASGQVVRSKRFPFPNPLGNLSYTKTKDFCKNGDDGWTILSTYDNQGHTARLDANWDPLWAIATTQDQLFTAEVEELRISTATTPGYVSFFNDSFGADRVNLFNDQGLIDDEECNIVVPFEFEPEDLSITLVDNNIASTEFSVTVADEEPTIDDVDFDVEYICQSPPLIPVIDGPPHIVIPVAICIDFTGLVFPGGGPLPGPSPGPIDFPSIFQRQACHDVPQCPNCMTMLDNIDQQVINPEYRANLYQTARPFVGASPGTLPLEALRPFADALAKVPDGRFLDSAAKDMVRQKFQRFAEYRQRNKSSDFVPRQLNPLPLVGYTLNLVTLDLVAPKFDKPTISNNGAGFGRLLRARTAKPAQLTGLQARLLPDSPTATQKYRPCIPAVFAEIAGDQLKTAGSLSVEFYYGGMQYEGLEKNLALVQWKDGRVKEITSVIDTRTKRITGIADGSGVFAVMQRNLAR